MYGLIWITDLQSYFEPLEILALIVSAISHDLDHDGYNNTFQINAGTHLAMIYNDYSPLEMYHCAVAFHILSKKHCRVFFYYNFVGSSYKSVLSSVSGRYPDPDQNVSNNFFDRIEKSTHPEAFHNHID
jgi:hypothetical protein